MGVFTIRGSGGGLGGGLRLGKESKPSTLSPKNPSGSCGSCVDQSLAVCLIAQVASVYSGEVEFAVLVLRA